jgi:hypothetical protein
MPETKSFSTPTPEPPTSQTKTTRPALTLFALEIRPSIETQRAGVKTPHVVGVAAYETWNNLELKPMKNNTKTRNDRTMRRAESALDFLLVLLIAGALTAGALHYFDVLIP